jgi:hypothetical protein
VGGGERQHSPDRVTAAQSGVEVRLVCGGGEAGEVATVLYRSLGDRQPGRGIGERAVGGEGGIAGEDHGRGEESEDDQSGADRPRIEAAEAPGKRGDRADAGEDDRHRGGVGHHSPDEGHRPHDDNQRRQADGRDQGAGEALTAQRIEQQPQPSANRQQDQREGDPGEEHPLRNLFDRPNLARKATARARRGTGHRPRPGARSPVRREKARLPGVHTEGPRQLARPF